jgi:hypothetical protein
MDNDNPELASRTRLANAVVRFLGSPYNHAKDYPPVAAGFRHPQNYLWNRYMDSLAPRQEAAKPRSPLFQAALDLLRGEPTVDPLAAIMRLRDAFPKASQAEIEQVVRETAVIFLAAGVVPR